MMERLYLTNDEVIGVTGKRKYSAQARALDAMRIAYKLRADGSIVVSRRDFELSFTGTKVKFPTQPDWSIENNPRPPRPYIPPKGKRTQPDHVVSPEIRAAIKEEHRKVVLYHSNNRRAGKLKRTPTWADHDAIRAMYDLAAKMSKDTGVPHHVDHIVPLQGQIVSGLHIAENMQVIPASENIRKSNKFEGDQC